MTDFPQTPSPQSPPLQTPPSQTPQTPPQPPSAPRPDPENERILDLVRRLGNGRGGVLTLADFCRETGVSPSSIHIRFGGWIPLRRAAGLPASRSYSGRGRVYTPLILLDWLQRARKEHGRYITRVQFCNFAGISQTAINTHWGSWRKLRAAAGLPERPQIMRQYRDIDLYAAMSRHVRKLGRFPSAEEINRDGEFSFATYAHRFGSHSDLKQRYDRFMDRVCQAYLNEQKREEEARRAQGEPKSSEPKSREPGT